MEHFGPYRITRKLGSGGCGVVYLARRETGGQEVALKLLEGPFEPAEEARFGREVDALARLSHPHVVKVYECGAEPRPWLAMEFVRGGTLADELARSGRLLVPAALEVGIAVAEAAGAAHAAGILHRDIKPANVLLRRDGTPLLSDFGLARSVDPQRGLTRTGEVIGSPGYLAPEQCGGDRPHSPATDVYGVGALLYACLSGEPPFRGALFDVLRRVLEEPPPPLRSRAPEVDPGLAEIVTRCLAKDPEERYPDGASLARELRAWRVGLRRGEEPGGGSLQLKVGVALCALALGAGWVGQRFASQAPETGLAPRASAPRALPSEGGATPGPSAQDAGEAFDAAGELARAREELHAGQAQEAQRRLEGVLKRAPSAQAYGDYGGLLAARGSYIAAQRAYEEGLRRVDPRDLELWGQLNLRLALMEALRGQRRAQLERVSRVLERWQSAEAYRMRSDARAALKDPAGALRDIDESLKLEPRSADGHALRGVLRARLGDYVGARAALEMALALEPQRERCRANLDQILRLAEEGLAQGRRLIQEGGDPRKAASLLERALASGEVEATYLLALARLRSDGSTDEVRRLLLEAADQGHVAACHDVGVNYERGIWGESQASRAEHYYRRAAEAGSEVSMLRLAVLYLSGGRPQDAEVWRARAEAAGSPDAKALRADGLRDAGQDEEADRLLEEARRAGSGWASYSLARRAEELGDSAKVERLLAEAIERGDLRACVRRGRQLLAEAEGREARRRARDLFHRAAVEGSLPGVVLLGEVLVQLKDPRALVWLRRGALRGSPRAMANCGRYLLAQEGVEAQAEGLEWLERALTQGEEVLPSLEAALARFEGQQGPAALRLRARCLEALALERPELRARAKEGYERAAAAGDAEARRRLEAWRP